MPLLERRGGHDIRRIVTSPVLLAAGSAVFFVVGRSGFFLVGRSARNGART